MAGEIEDEAAPAPAPEGGKGEGTYPAVVEAAEVSSLPLLDQPVQTLASALAGEAPVAPLAPPAERMLPLPQSVHTEGGTYNAGSIHTWEGGITVLGGEVGPINQNIQVVNNYFPPAAPGAFSHSPNTAGEVAQVGREELTKYFESMLPQWRTLDLGGLASVAGQSLPLPLEEVYVSLQAEKSSESERKSESRLLDLEILEALHEKRWLERVAAARPDEVEDATLRGIIREWPYLERRYLQKLAEEEVELHQVVQRHQTLVILGDPGGGKTTLLKYLALQHAKALLAGAERVVIETFVAKKFSWEVFKGEVVKTKTKAAVDLGPARLPIVIRLASYAATLQKGDMALLDFVGVHLRDWWQVTNLSEASLNRLVQSYAGQGRILFLLDGLDEVAEVALRQQVAGAVSRFVQEMSATGNQIVITSRVIGYPVAPVTAPSHYRVREMSDATIRRFLARFCQAVELAAWQAQHGGGGEEKTTTPSSDAAELERCSQAHLTRLEEAIFAPDGRVRRLAVNPLLLSMLALIQRESGTVPSLRFELYEKSVKTLVKTWRPAPNEPSGMVEWDERWVVTMLGPLALWMYTERVTGLATEAELYHHLAARLNPAKLLPDYVVEQQARRLIEKVRQTSGLIVARGKNIYAFVHRSFQEYLVASELLREAGHLAEFALAHLFSARWHVPLLLAVGGLAYRQEFTQLEATLTTILSQSEEQDPLQRHLLFVAEAMLECAFVPAPLVRQLIQKLVQVYVAPYLGRKFKPLASQIAELLSRWKTASWAVTAEVSLVTALQEGDGERQQSLAALLAGAMWATRGTLLALRQAEAIAPDNLTRYRLGRAYDELAKSKGAVIPPEGLVLRRACLHEPGLWQLIEANANLSYLVIGLYGVVGEKFKPEGISREAPLTGWLLAALRPHIGQNLDGDAQKALVGGLAQECREWLVAYSTPASEWTARGLALLYLSEGDETNFVSERLIQINSAELLEHWLVYLARARALEFAIVITRALARAPGFARVLDPAIPLYPAIPLSPGFALGLDPAIPRVLALARDFARSWEQLAEGTEEQREKSLTVLTEFEILWFNDAAAQSMETLWRTGRPDYLKLLTRLRSDAKVKLAPATVTTLQSWLAELPPHLQIYPLLLLAETGQSLPLDWLSPLATALQNPDDALRARAQAILQMERKLSELSPARLLQLARLSCAADKAKAGYASLVLNTALRKVRYDDPALFSALCQAANSAAADETGVYNEVLSHSYRLDTSCTAIFRHYLQNGARAVQLALAEAARWLLAQEEPPEIESALLALLKNVTQADSELFKAALAALSYTRKPQTAVVEKLLAYSGQGPAEMQAFAWHGLARLAARSESGQKERILAALEAALQPSLHPHIAAGALVRFYFYREALKEEAERDWPGVMAAVEKQLGDPAEQLMALLAAGNDDDGWNNDYHGQLAEQAAEIVDQHPELLTDLFTRLEESKNWQEQRIVVAALAYLARRAPALYSLQTLPHQAEELLLRACQNADSFNVRRFGLLAISRLRKVTPRISELLLAACQDDDVVVRDVTEAVQQFREILPETLDTLVQGLQHQSARARAATASLIAELCVSAVTPQQRAELEAKALPALVAALQDEASDTFCTYYDEQGKEQTDRMYNILYRAYYRARLA